MIQYFFSFAPQSLVVIKNASFNFKKVKATVRTTRPPASQEEQLQH
jgi:hypothetical protein